jgi:hypothetical protein
MTMRLMCETNLYAAAAYAFLVAVAVSRSTG